MSRARVSRTPEERRAARRARRRETARALPITVAALVGTGAAASSLGVIFPDPTWWTGGMLIAIAALTVITALRFIGAGSRLLPSLAGPVVVLLAVTAACYPSTAIGGVVPTPATFAALSAGLDDAVPRLVAAVAPTEVPDGFLPILLISLPVVAIVVDLLAVPTPSLAALAGLPLIAVPLVVPPIVGEDVSPVVLVVVAVSWLAMLWFDRMRRGAAARPATAVAIGGVAVVVALVAPTLPSLDQTIDVGGDGPVSPLFSLGADLRSAGEQPVIRYRTEAGPQYLVLSHIADFTGGRWGPSVDDGGAGSILDFPLPPGRSPDTPTIAAQVHLELLDIASEWLPLPVGPQRIAGLNQDRWIVERSGPAVRGVQVARSGLRYSVETAVLDVPDDELATLDAGAGGDLERYLAVPEETPAVVGETARAVTAGIDSPYRQTQALVDFFRSGDFSYDEQSPARDGWRDDQLSVLADFLDVRRGYCVHYASAMAMMARELGIPSRIAVGYAPVAEDDDEIGGMPTYTVPASALHAWPQLYFAGVGWVDFEPTPGFGAGGSGGDDEPTTAPTTTTPTTTAPTTTAPTTTAPSATTTTPTSAPTTTPDTDPVARDAALAWVWPTVLGVLVLAFLLAVAAPAGRMLQRAGRLAGGVEGAWQEVLATAVDVGSRPAVAESPRMAADRIRTRLGDDALGREALALLTARVERARFAAADEAPEPPTSRALAFRVRRALLLAADPRGRVRRALLPASLFVRDPAVPRD